MYKVSVKSERVTWGPLVELTWNDLVIIIVKIIIMIIIIIIIIII